MLRPKAIISVNPEKFMEIPVMDCLEMILSYGVDGIEVHIDFYNPEQMQYLEELAKMASVNNLRLLVHADSEVSLNDQKEFLRIVSKSDCDGPILTTFHPVYDDDILVSQQKTTEYLNELNKNIDQKKIMMLVENLNDNGPQRRLKTREILPIVESIPEIGMTFDIGHVICDGIKDLAGFSISPEVVGRTKNLHIHATKDGIDHLPIRLNDEDLELMLNVVPQFLNAETIVFEYDLYQCKGETVQEQILDYFDSISFFMKMLRERGVIE